MEEPYLSEITMLYTTQYGKLISFALGALKSEKLAEEAVQETFRIACQKAEVLHNHENKEGWLQSTLKNVISNIERIQGREKRNMMEYSALVTKLQETSVDINVDLLYTNIATLDEYILIKEFILDQKKIEELAQSRGISIAACKKRIQRAKENLRRILENES